MNLSKQVDFDEVEVFVHFLLLGDHFVGVVELLALAGLQVVEGRKVQGEGLFEEDVGDLLVAADQLGLEQVGGGDGTGIGVVMGRLIVFVVFILLCPLILILVAPYSPTPTPPLLPLHQPLQIHLLFHLIPPKPIILRQFLLNGPQVLIKRHLHLLAPLYIPPHLLPIILIVKLLVP